VLIPFGLGYLLSFLYRTVNVVIGPEIARSLGLSAADLGLLTGVYFISFAAFQVPLGVLLDRYGPRRVEAALLPIAAAGALIFSLGETTFGLAIGRALIGLGVSSCLMAAIKANVQWWPRDRLPLANGVILAMGGLGAVVATSVVQQALMVTEWRGVFVALAIATVALGAGIFFIVPDAPLKASNQCWTDAVRSAFKVFGDARFLHIAPIAALNQASFLAYTGLWAGAWLRDVDHLDPSRVANILAIATTGIIIGSLGAGSIAARLGRRGVPVARVAITGSLGYMLVQLALIVGLPLPHWLIWGLFTCFGMTGTLYYSVLAQAFPPEVSGRVTTALTTLFFIAAFLVQWLVGVFLPLVSEATGGTEAAHRSILGLILLLHAAAVIWYVVFRGRGKGFSQPSA
jgi:MFS family permease